MRPTDKCPFIEKFDDHDTFLHRVPAACKGQRIDGQRNHRVVYNCMRDAMVPPVYYADSE